MYPQHSPINQSFTDDSVTFKCSISQGASSAVPSLVRPHHIVYGRLTTIFLFPALSHMCLQQVRKIADYNKGVPLTASLLTMNATENHPHTTFSYAPAHPRYINADKYSLPTSFLLWRRPSTRVQMTLPRASRQHPRKRVWPIPTPKTSVLFLPFPFFYFLHFCSVSHPMFWLLTDYQLILHQVILYRNTSTWLLTFWMVWRKFEATKNAISSSTNDNGTSLPSNPWNIHQCTTVVHHDKRAAVIGREHLWLF